MSKIMDDPRIDAGIESYPLAELPEGFIERTMGRVERARLVPRFQLRFSDLAIPAFFLVFAVTFAGVVVWVSQTVDRVWVEYLKLKLAYYQLRLLPGLMGFQKINLMVYVMIFLVVMEVIWIVSRPKRIAGKLF